MQDPILSSLLFFLPCLCSLLLYINSSPIHTPAEDASDIGEEEPGWDVEARANQTNKQRSSFLFKIDRK